MADNKIRILRIIARLNIGGPSIHVTLLNAGLDQNRFTSLLVAGTENPGEGSMLDYALSRGVQPLTIPEIVGEASFKPRDRQAVAKLYHLIRQERPHIVHTHTAKAGFLGRLAARWAGVPIVIHTYHGHVLRGYYSTRKTWLLRRMEQALGYMSDTLIAVSEQVKHDLVTFGVAPAKKIVVIPLGFDLEPFLQSGARHGEFRRDLGLGNDVPLIGIVGRIFPIKNHRLFLDAAARVSVQLPAARFVVVGDGILRQEMEQYAKQLGVAERVIFTGWRRDLPPVYADLNVLVVSSDNEGTPVSAIEAMAAGCPVVATRVGGLPDIIADGTTGFLVPPRDAAKLAAAVTGALADPAVSTRIGSAAQNMARARFTARRLIADTEALYQQLLVKKGIVA